MKNYIVYHIIRKVLIALGHGDSDIGNMFGGYDCHCGEPWMTHFTTLPLPVGGSCLEGLHVARTSAIATLRAIVVGSGPFISRRRLERIIWGLEAEKYDGEHLKEPLPRAPRSPTVDEALARFSKPEEDNGRSSS